MRSTLDLLDKALKDQPSERALSMALKLDPTTLAKARRRGRLSPILAGKVAELTGQPVAAWIAQAALEAEPNIPGVDAIRRVAATVRNSYFAHIKRAARTLAVRVRTLHRTSATHA